MTEIEMKEVYGLIREVGGKPTYMAYHWVAEAVKIFLETGKDHLKITKDVYPHLATKFKVTPGNVEHNIRTLVKACWDTNRDSLEEIAGYALEQRPTNFEFVEILASYLEEKLNSPETRFPSCESSGE